MTQTETVLGGLHAAHVAVLYEQQMGDNRHDDRGGTGKLQGHSKRRLIPVRDPETGTVNK